MATKKTGDPLAHLESEGPRLVYAIDGDERILVDEAVAAIKKVALPARGADFNFDSFIAQDTPVARIVEAASMLPAFAQRRVVLVKAADKLPAEGAETLIAYLQDPSPTTVLMLVANEKFDARTKLYKALEKAGATLRFMHPNEREMPQLVRARVKLIGASIDDGAVRMLIEAVGADLAGVSAALEQLALYVGKEKRAITAADVEALISPAREESIFAFSDAVGRGDATEALRGLHNMLTVARDHPLALLGMIARHWRKLLIARSLLDAGAQQSRIQSELQLPPFIVDKMLSQARRHGVAGLTRGLRAIAAADQALKGGKLEGERVMERLVLVLARAKT